HSGQKTHDRTDAHQDGRSTKVGLTQNKYGRQQYHYHRGGKEYETPDIFRSKLMEISRQRQDQGEFHKLRRLQVHSPHAEPAFSPHPGMPDHVNHYQYQKAEEINKIGIIHK